VCRHRLAELVDPFEAPVGVIFGADQDLFDSRWSSLIWSDLGLTLAEVAPVGVAVPEAALVGLVDNEDHSHVGNLAEGAAWRSTIDRVVGHRGNVLQRGESC